MGKGNSFTPVMTSIEKVTTLTEDTKMFRVKYPCNHMPGQFVEVSVLGVGECPISIASYSDEYLDLCIRNVGTVTKSLFSFREKKDKVGVRGPYGNGYPMESFKDKPIVLVAGGTGAAPLRGVIKYLEHMKDHFKDVQMFFGFRTPEDILFKDDMARWKKMFDLTLTVDKKTKGWRGNVGVITDPLKKAKIPKDATILICGPPIMIKFVKQTLFDKGISPHQIWLSLERDMQCGIGKCGHCMINNKYVCKDGPVFNLSEIEDIKGE